jgi:hypothetical protein
MNNSMTNIVNVHTCTISCNDLIYSLILLFGGVFFYLSNDVICCCRVRVPICVNHIAVHSYGCTLVTIVLRVVGLIISVPAV